MLIVLSCKKREKNEVHQNHIEYVDDCYINFNIKYKTVNYPVVYTSLKLAGLIEMFVFNKELSDDEFKKYLDTTLHKYGYIPVNDTMYGYLRDWIVNFELINKYDGIDVVEKYYLNGNRRFPDSTNFENEKALIYTLTLKNLMRCCRDDETGITVLLNIKDEN